MALKIEFVSDIKGYERVQKSLEENQKALNASADAMARLNSEQSKLGSASLDIKGIDAIKNASKSVQDLAKSFDTLMSGNKGIASFTGMFSGLRKEINELNREQGNTILDTMGKQIGSLRDGSQAAIDTVKRLRMELKDLDESNQPDFVKKHLGDQKRAEMAEATSAAQMSNESANKLAIQKMLRQPILGAGADSMGMDYGNSGIGKFLGDTSLMRLGKIGGAMVAGTYAARQAGTMGLNMMYGEERMDNAMYREQRGVLSDAQGGNIARLYNQSTGTGHEGRMKRNVENGDGFFGTKLGDSTAESWMQKLKMLPSILIDSATIGLSGAVKKNMLGLTQEQAALDEARNDAINTSMGRTKGIMTSGSFMGLEAGKGYGYVRGLQSTLAAGNLSLDEAAPALFQARGYGVTDYAARSGLARGSGETGVSDSARGEIFRQQSYNRGSGRNAYNNYGKILSVASSAGIDTSNMSYREAITDVVTQRTMSMAGQVDAGQVTAPMQQALSIQGGAGVNLSVPERIQQANQVQNTAQGRAGQAGTMMNMALEHKLISAGIRNAFVRQQIIQLVSSGQGKQAAQIISKQTGKSVAEAESLLNDSKKIEDNMRTQVLYGSEAEKKKVEGDFASVGKSSVGMAIGGSATDTMSVKGAGAVYEGTTLLGEDISKGKASTSLPGQVTGRQVKGADAKFDDNLMRMTTALTDKAGSEGDKLVAVFTDYLGKFTSHIQEQLGKVSLENQVARDNASPMVQNMGKFKEQFPMGTTPSDPKELQTKQILKAQDFATPKGKI